MFHVVPITTLILVALAMAPAVAHAFEYPGKNRLNRDAYLAVQGIYYPGFTFLGIAEPLALIAAIALLTLTPTDTRAFSFTLVVVLGLLGMQVVYWTLTHPVNKSWVQAVRLGDAGGRFFAAGRGAAHEMSWTEMRDRWEYSHIARAVLVFVSFCCLVFAF